MNNNILSHYDVIIFDLDGTLVDTSKGIYSSVRYAENKMNFFPIPENRLSCFVGPPPIQMYTEMYDVSPDVAKQATLYHREYAAKKGIYEAELYEGVEKRLMKLKREGKLLAVATLKSQVLAEEILLYFDMKKYFDVIVGVDKDELLTKENIINIALNKVGCVDKASAVLIGDTKYDAIGAEKANIDFIGVTYGFGFQNSHELNEYSHIACFDKL